MDTRDPPETAIEEEIEVFLRGVRLFNECRYFDAHDVWEEIWHMAKGEKRLFYQGLIHAAVTMEHYLRGNPRGVDGVWRMTQEKLGSLGKSSFMGLRIEPFLHDLRRAIHPALEIRVGRSLMRRGAVLPFDTADAPQIVLGSDLSTFST